MHNITIYKRNENRIDMEIIAWNSIEWLHRNRHMCTHRDFCKFLKKMEMSHNATKKKNNLSFLLQNKM